MTAGTPAVDPLRHGLRRATSPFQGELLVETAGSLQRGSVLALSVFAAQIHLPQRGRLWQYGKAPGFAKGSPFGGAVTAGD